MRLPFPFAAFGFVLMAPSASVTFHEAVHSLYPDGSAYPIHECPVYGHQVKNEAVQDAPEVFVSRAGRFFPIKYSVAPLRGGYEHGAVIEFRDVSEEKRMEQERLTALVESEQQTERVRQEEKHRKQMGEFIDYVGRGRVACLVDVR